MPAGDEPGPPTPLVIRTPRLVLRDFGEDDWRALLRYQRHPEYQLYHPDDEHDEASAREFVRRFIGWSRSRPRYKFQLAITLRESGDLIGNVGVRMQGPGSPIAEIGYEVDPDWWGLGYATEAAIAMRDFAFGELGIHRLESRCIAENVASARVLERLGMRCEGRLREAEYFRDRWWDLLLFGMLEGDHRRLLHEPG